MCGIVGLITADTFGFQNREINAVQDMLFVNTLRGFDSTGVFTVLNNNDVHIHKEASAGYKFLCSDEWKDTRTVLFQKGKFFVGHNRAATRGSISDNNAHPFWVKDKIILAQNGTFKGPHRHIKDTEVDTEAIAYLLAEEPDIEKALQQVNAAYALIWYNVEKKQLHAIRNNERPLWIAYTKSGSIILSSEKGIIQFAVDRNNIELNGDPYLVDDNTLCTYTMLDDGKFEEEYTKIDNKYKSRSFPDSFANAYNENCTTFNNYVEYPDKENKYFGDFSRRTWNYTALQKIQEMKDVIMYSKEEIKKWENIYPSGKEVVLEPIDYLPANDHRDCLVWYIVGKPVTVDIDSNKEIPHFFWKVEGIQDSEVLMRYFDSLFKLTVSWSNTTYSNNDKQHLAFSCYKPQSIKPELTH